jgi:hypothetical protein
MIAMRRLLLVVIGLGFAGCGGPRTEQPVSTRPEIEPAVTTRPSVATEPAVARLTGVPVVLAGRDCLFIQNVTAHLRRKSVRYCFAQAGPASRPVSSGPAGEGIVSYALAPLESGGPAVECQIECSDAGRQVSIVLTSRANLPAMTVGCALPAGMVLVRSNPPEGEFASQVAIGLATRAVFDSLMDTATGATAAYEGNVTWAADPTGYRLTCRSEAASAKRSTMLTLRLPYGPEHSWSAQQGAPLVPSALAPQVALEQARCLATQWALGNTLVLPPPPGCKERYSATQPSLKDFAALPAERTALLRQILPLKGLRGVDRFPAADPGVTNLAIGSPPRQWNVLAMRSTSDRGSSRTVHLKALGIAASSAEQSAVYDFWQQQLLAITEDAFDLDLPPGVCRLVGVHRISTAEPTVIGTNGDITQGFYDLTEVLYDPGTMTLAGESTLTADEPYELRIVVPVGARSVEISGIETGGLPCLLRTDGPLRIVTFESSIAQTVAWRIRFRSASQSFGPPAPPARLTARQNTRGVLLNWETGEQRPVRYRLYRDGAPLATMAGFVNQYQDSAVEYNHEYRYAMRSVDWAGRESGPSPQLGHRTPIPANSYLTQLTPLSLIEGQLPLRTDRSVGGNPLRMAGRRYHRGLGVSAGTRIEYFLGKGYDLFTGEVGIDDEAGGKGTARFEIHADGTPLFRSSLLRGGQKPQRFEVSVRGRRTLTLMVLDGAGPGSEAHADWGDLYLRTSPRMGR